MMLRFSFRHWPKLITPEEAEAFARRILSLVGEPLGEVRLGHSVKRATSFSRGDVHMVEDTIRMDVTVIIKGCTGITTRIDDEGLKAIIAYAKDAARDIGTREPDASWMNHGPVTIGKRPQLRFEATTDAMMPESRATLVRHALDATEGAGLVGAGDIAFTETAELTYNAGGLIVHKHKTYGEFSLTARTADGTGSGWGWSGHEDWNRVKPDAVIARAVDLAQRSAHPVAVEPGRYTVILEPTATAALLEGIEWEAWRADAGLTPFAKDPVGTNKIGLQMLDARLQTVNDPWDPEVPHDVVGYDGETIGRTVWFENGFLRELSYDETYASQKHRAPTDGDPRHIRLFGQGAAQTLEEMIASTKRGLWVNRLSGLFKMNGRTHLVTGTTRDGTFLIENGKITKAVKNFRFTESPFFVLNKLEAFGEPERASALIAVPRVKVRDFDFTSLTDAV